MRKVIVLFTMLFISGYSYSQNRGLIADKEKLFSKEEAYQIDSLLQGYNNKTSNLVAVYTDSSDVSAADFGDKVYTLFKTPVSDSSYCLLLLMSKNHSLLFLTVNRITTPFVNQQLLIGILEAGFASFKEKRRAEGVILICKKAMEFLDKLPKR